MPSTKKNKKNGSTIDKRGSLNSQTSGSNERENKNKKYELLILIKVSKEKRK